MKQILSPKVLIPVVLLILVLSGFYYLISYQQRDKRIITDQGYPSQLEQSMIDYDKKQKESYSNNLPAFPEINNNL